MKYNLLAYKIFMYNYLSYSDDDVDIHFEDVLVYSFGLKENSLSRGQNKRGGGEGSQAIFSHYSPSPAVREPK